MNLSMELEYPFFKTISYKQKYNVYLINEKKLIIMGVAGACRCNELTYLKIENVQDKGKYLFITIADTKTYVFCVPTPSTGLW
jgi:hypothetical protein